MDTVKMNSMGLDAGMGAIKVWSEDGGLDMLSQVATNGGGHFENMIGMKTAVRPLMVETVDGEFYVGERAHNYGRPVENMNFDRFGGSPEMRVMVYGTWTRYMQAHGTFDGPLSVMVGLPLQTMGESLKESRLQIRRWLMGVHRWKADGVEYVVDVKRVRWNSQPVGAWFDYLMEVDGTPTLGHERALRDETAILSVGFNTLELMVVQNQTVNERFTAGRKLGVRRLLDLVSKKHSLGELDVMLRSGNLKYKDKLPIWASEVSGAIEDVWGDDLSRFAAVLVVGGGALLLGNYLNLVSDGIDKKVLSDEAVLTTARGLWKLDVNNK